MYTCGQIPQNFPELDEAVPIDTNYYDCVIKMIFLFLNQNISLFVLFDLSLYVPSTIFQLNRDGSSWVEPVLS